MRLPTYRLFQLLLFNGIVLSIFIMPCFSQQSEIKRQEPNNKGEGKAGKRQRNTEVQISNGNIVLGNPTDKTITANVLLEKGIEAFIEYGKVRDQYNYKTAIVKSSGEPLVITLNALTPGSQYFYRLNFKNAGEKTFRQSASSWFATQKKSGTAFSFGVQGDSHPEREGKMFNPLLYKQTIDSVAVYQPDFYFLMGDDFSIDKLIERNEVNQTNVENAYLVQRYYLGNAGTNPPLFLVNGNHEQAAKYLLDGTANNAAVLAANSRKKYFPLPVPDQFFSGDTEQQPHIGLLSDYYAFEWGNALFVVIDPYWHSDSVVDNKAGHDKIKKRNLWDNTLGETQYKWFKQTLENSKAKFKFVFSHHVLGTGRGGVERARLFEWGGYGQNGAWQFNKERPGWEFPIHQLMVNNKVTIFFQGHDHIFAKQELDGVIYQSVPNPADDSYTAFNRDAYTSGDILPNSGFLNVSVTAKEVIVKYVRSYMKDESATNDEAKKTFIYTIH